MAQNSKIEWTHHTFNPWEGCQKVGQGCDNCYAEARTSGSPAGHIGDRTPRAGAPAWPTGASRWHGTVPQLRLARGTACSAPRWPNVWLGCTVVNQAEADRDIPKLLAVPAAVRFLSMEPLLGPVTLNSCDLAFGLIDLVIVGGESGPGARVWPGFEDAARDLRDQCKSAGVAFFMKQMAGARKASMPPIPDDLMVREMPDAR